MQFDFCMYKDYPIVRCGNSIYYGYMSDPYVIMMQIQHQKQMGEFKIADKIKIYKISTDEKLNPMQATVKTTERGSLYEALDLAYAWLNRNENNDNK